MAGSATSPPILNALPINAAQLKAA